MISVGAISFFLEHGAGELRDKEAILQSGLEGVCTETPGFRLPPIRC
jgi:hypothetical protein